MVRHHYWTDNGRSRPLVTSAKKIALIAVHNRARRFTSADNPCCTKARSLLVLVCAPPFRSERPTFAQGLPSIVRRFGHQGLEMTFYKRVSSQPYDTSVGIRIENFKAELSQVG